MALVEFLVALSAVAAKPDVTEAEPVSPLTRLGARYGFEASIGFYLPRVDQEFSTASPYADIFGRESELIGQLRVHWFFPTVVGDLGLALGLGYFTDRANALTESGERSAGETAMRLIPASLLARWRWTGLERWTGLPLAFNVAGGINYTFWTITKGDGATAEVAGLTGSGGTLSAQVEGGVGLRLGRLDPRGAKVLRTEFGISDTEIGFGVVYVSAPIGWWDSLHVSDISWRTYLLVHF